MPNHPDNDRDEPLITDWCVSDPTFFDGLNLPTMRRAGVEMRDRILTQAVVVGRNNPDRWISYSRRPAWYAKRCSGRYHHPSLTLANVRQSIDELAGSGFLDHQQADPGDIGRQSRFKASRVLLAFADDERFVPIFNRREIIVLRDMAHHPIDYRETGATQRMRRDLARINEMIIGSSIMLGGIVIRDGMRLPIEQKYPRAVHASLHRVFSRGSWSMNGRFYGGWWISLSKEMRATIEIDGEQVDELDYDNMHPTLLYAEKGLSLTSDAYTLENWPRPLVKKAMHAVINSDTETAALRSIALQIGGLGAFMQAQRLMEAIKTKHASIADQFFSGAGLRGMGHDSAVAEQVMLELDGKGIPTLPIHDSFLVASRHRSALAEAMDRALLIKLRALSGNRVRSTGFLENVPQNEGKPLTAPCDLNLRRPNAKKDKPESQSTADRSDTADQPKAAANDNGQRRDVA